MQTFYAFDKHGNFWPCSDVIHLDSEWETDEFIELFPGPLALKLYAEGETRNDSEHRLQALLHIELSAFYADVENAKKHIKFAWPQEILYESINRNSVLGFSLPAIAAEEAINLQSFHNAEARSAAGFSSAGTARLAIARSLVAVIAELNAAQIYVPNLHNQNIFVYKNHRVALVNCDDFGFKAQQQYFPGGAPDLEICAPEYFEQAIGVEENDIAQGRFALGVQLFQLLNSGIHPFDGDPKQGISKDDFPDNRKERIAAGYYPYGVISHSLIAPVDGGSSHENFPLELCELFERCFLGPAANRPDAVEWHYYLANLDQLELSHDSQKLETKLPEASVAALVEPVPMTAQADFPVEKPKAWLTQRKYKSTAIVLVVVLWAAAAWSFWQLPNIRALVSENLALILPQANPQQTPSAAYEIVQDKAADNLQVPVEVSDNAVGVDELKQNVVVANETPQTKRTSKIKQGKVNSPACKQLIASGGEC